MRGIGRITWAKAGGHIPLRSTGPEPAFTSREELVLLNAGEREAHVTIAAYYADRDPVTGYEITVGARRVRAIRANDLIDPEALPLGIDYGALITSDVPIVVQFARVDTSRDGLSLLGTVAFPGDVE